MRTILASASPRRKELLQLAGLQFEVHAADTEELILPGQSPAEAAAGIAREKAAAVAALYPGDCVIAADTVVAVDGQILGKPTDCADAARMLRLLSGRAHRVITGVALRLGERELSFAQETRVRFFPLSEAEISAYVRSGEPMDKAGGYGIQGLGALLVEGIEGDYFNVVGLPVARLMRTLSTFIDNSRG